MDTLTVQLSMREVGRRETSTSWTVHLRVPAGSFFVDAIRDGRHGRLMTFLAKEPHFSPPGDCGLSGGSSTVRSCDGLAAVADPRHDALDITVPRECLNDPRWVQVGVDVDGGFEGTSGEFTIHSDEWAPPGSRDSGHLPPYGPRVRRG